VRELSLDRLRTLVTIAELGSFAAAARTLHLAPPTISLHVAELESQLGAQLMLRNRQRVQTTSAGTALVERARRLLADADQMLDELRRQIEGQSALVRLGASTGVLAHLLPEALEALRHEQPGVEVRVAVVTSQDAMARIASAALDIALVALPQRPVPGVRVVAWRRDPIMAFVPAAWQPPQRLTPAWLAARPLIANESNTRLARMTSDWFARAGLHPRPQIELNYNDAMRSLVAAGYGAALLPHEASAPPPDERIAMRPLRPALWRALGIAHRKDGLTPSVRLAIELLMRLRASPIG
jgi:DNA-binding transcriptional LysR family regulator